MDGCIDGVDGGKTFPPTANKSGSVFPIRERRQRWAVGVWVAEWVGGFSSGQWQPRQIEQFKLERDYANVCTA